MGLRINTNLASINAQRMLSQSTAKVEKAQERLASGSRINNSSDDVAGLAIAEQLRSVNRGQAQAERNAQNAISFFQVAEGGLSEVNNIIIRTRELAVQSASDTVGEQERGFLNLEGQQLKQELDRIVKTTEFSGKKLLDGSAGTLDFQVGAKGGDDYKISYDAGAANASTSELGVDGFDLSTKSGAQSALDHIDDALSKVGSMRANFGAVQSRMQSTIANLGVAQTSFTAAESRIRDADMAVESSNLAQAAILREAGTAVLAQANSNNQAALKLL